MRIGICDDVKDEQEETKNCLYNNCNLKGRGYFVLSRGYKKGC